MNAYIARSLALLLGLFVAAPLAADPTLPGTDEDDIEILLVNEHDEDVRVFAERADGRLFVLDRVRRGESATLEVPSEQLGSGYRLKIVRVPVDIWDFESDLKAIKTSPLDNAEMSRVVVRLTDYLPASIVEVTER